MLIGRKKDQLRISGNDKNGEKETRPTKGIKEQEQANTSRNEAPATFTAEYGYQEGWVEAVEVRMNFNYNNKL